MNNFFLKQFSNFGGVAGFHPPQATGLNYKVEKGSTVTLEFY